MLWDLGRRWGATPDEHAHAYRADSLVDDPVERLTRAVDVDAPPELVYRWLGQLRFAPYSYDWLDNRGRRSPQQLAPEAGDLVVGERLMGIFRVVDVQPGAEFSAVMLPRPARLFGPIAVTYAAHPRGDATRLVCRLGVGRSLRSLEPVLTVLGLGDLVMMRRQLLNLRDLAERDARSS